MQIIHPFKTFCSEDYFPEGVFINRASSRQCSYGLMKLHYIHNLLHLSNLLMCSVPLMVFTVFVSNAFGMQCQANFF